MRIGMLILGPGTSSSGSSASPLTSMLLILVLVLLGAKLAGEAAKRLGQPSVLGELLAGVVLGNLVLAGGPDLAAFAHNRTFEVFAELGAILLLFQVGLESTPKEMLAVGGRALVVATLGVVTPVLLGFGVGTALHPGQPWLLHAFLGAMLAATSVGITARVFQDLGMLRTPTARIVLGAAVVDDVMGLIVLAVISGSITAAGSGESLSLAAIVLIVAKALAFLVTALVVGSFLSPRVFRTALLVRSTGVVQVLSLSLCFVLSYLALEAGLAPIVGAFAAGLVLEEVHFEGQMKRGEPPLHQTLEPVVALFVPAFFVRMGMLVDLSAFASMEVLGFALALTAAAALGKLACGLAVPHGISGLTVGLGMMPRGEVGLIFAGIGTQLVLDGIPVVSPRLYAAAVFMVVATTLATPPLLSWAARRSAVAAGVGPSAGTQKERP
jgi:Kef-type K+ transport system membrane component KefB